MNNNNFTKEEAFEIWENEIGKPTYAYDFSGRKIKKTEYGEKNQVGWEIGFIKPLEFGGKVEENNFVIMHYHTLEEKGLNYPNFTVEHNKYKIVHDEEEDFDYIEEILYEEDD